MFISSGFVTRNPSKASYIIFGRTKVIYTVFGLVNFNGMEINRYLLQVIFFMLILI